MAYIGKAPNTAIVNQATSQSFSGNGSTTVFTLTRSVNVGEDLEVFVNNVQQEPGSGKSYTASGTTLTFDEAPPSGTNNIYVIYRGEATINPRLEHDANAALSAASGTFSSSSSGEFNALTISQANNTSGNESRISFKRTTDAGSDREVAAIVADRVGGNDTALVFETNTDGSDGATERVRINQDGNVGVGTTSPSDFGGTTLQTNHGSTYCANLVSSGTHVLQMIASQTHGAMSMGARSNHHVAFTTNDTERMRIDTSGRVGIGTNSPDADLHVNSGDASTNYSGGSLLLSNPGMDTNYGATYLYHHKAGGSGNQNAAFNISQRTAAGAYVSNVWNVDYQNSVQSFYVPNGGISGAVALGIDGSGRVTAPKVPAFNASSGGSTTSTGAFYLGSTDKSQTVSHNVNNGGHHNTTNGRFTAPVAGHYFFSAMASPSQGANSGIYIEKNGSQVSAAAYVYGQSYNGSSVCCVVYMAANDYANGVFVPFNGTTEGQYAGNFTGFLIG